MHLLPSQTALEQPPKLLASFWPPVKLQSRCYSNRKDWRGTLQSMRPVRCKAGRTDPDPNSWKPAGTGGFSKYSPSASVILLQKILPREVQSVITTSSIHPTTKTKVQFHQDQRFDSRAIRRHYFKAVVIIKTEARRLTKHSGKTLC